jgi:hypothetical protein
MKEFYIQEIKKLKRLKKQTTSKAEKFYLSTRINLYKRVLKNNYPSFLQKLWITVSL